MDSIVTPIPDSIRAARSSEEAAAIFTRILGDKVPPGNVRDRLITVEGSRIYEATGSAGVLSAAVFASNFLRVETPCELDHYTTFDGLRGIVTSRRLYLTSLSKRLADDEYVAFAREHNLSGYLDLPASQPGSAEPLYHELAKNLFYCSFSSSANPNPTQLWDDFANCGRGVRITFRINATKRAELRQMRYQESAPTTLKKINDALLSELKMTYLPWSISRICAFSLTFRFHGERETRLIIKRHEGVKDHSIPFNGHSVWPIPLINDKAADDQASDNDFLPEISLVKIMTGRKCSESAVRSVLQATPFQNVPIEPFAG